MGEIRDLILYEMLHEGISNYISATKYGIKLMKKWVSLFAADGYEYSPIFYDSSDGVTWPVVHTNNSKQIFEYDNSMYIKDADTWLLIDHDDLKYALNRYATDVFTKGVLQEKAKKRFWDDIRISSYVQ